MAAPAAPQKKKSVFLLDSEKAQYGDRTCKGFDKLDLLGKGGCALVWLGREQATGKKVAMKQFAKSKNDSSEQTGKVETQVFKILNGLSGSPGLKNISFLLGKHSDNKDLWLLYELGGQCLGK